MMTTLRNYLIEVSDAMNKMVVIDSNSQMIDSEKALDIWTVKAKSISDIHGLFFFCGNGASATMAEHMSHDCFQNADFQTYTVSETSHITAISNDLSYEEVFAYRIKKMCSAKDMLITISSSGNSPNVIRAIHTARETGMFIVTLSGKSPDNKSRQLGDLNFYVPLDTYGLVESAHSVLLHYWLDLYLDKYMGGRH